MDLCELRAPCGATKVAKRKGRGHGTGNGKTAGKGHKGQNARSGGGVRLGFEGGQMPIYRRLPKRGFTNIFSKQYTAINLERLANLEPNSVVTAELLKQKGIISKIRDGLVILGRGEVGIPLNVKARRFSKSAMIKIQESGGTTEVI